MASCGKGQYIRGNQSNRRRFRIHMFKGIWIYTPCRPIYSRTQITSLHLVKKELMCLAQKFDASPIANYDWVPHYEA